MFIRNNSSPIWALIFLIWWRFFVRVQFHADFIRFLSFVSLTSDFFLIGWIKRCWKKRKRAGVGTLLFFPTLFYSYIGFLSIYVNGSLTFCEVLFIVLSLLRFRFLVSLCQYLYMAFGWYKHEHIANICVIFIWDRLFLCAGFWCYVLRFAVVCRGVFCV